LNLSRRRRSRRGLGRWTERGVLITCGAAAGAIASRLERRRHRPHLAREDAETVATDTTLAERVDTGIFVPPSGPAGTGARTEAARGGDG
jgi:hypothetical protein